MRVSTFPLLALLPLVAAHARIKSPVPLGAPPEDISGNDYNAPLAPDGSQFPCNNLHTNPDVDQTPTQSWQAGSLGSFEILGHVTAGEGALAAHSGGSCQASISFDNGKSFRVLHTYHGGCPRDVPFGSNFAGPNQTFAFSIPSDTRAGPALFAWTWIAVSGNRDEFYMNCAAVDIVGSGTSTLADTDYPHMFVGDMNLPGQIADGECRSTAGTALLYPDPGPAERVTVDRVGAIPFEAPSKGRCVAPGAESPGSAVSRPATTASPAVLLPTGAASSSGAAYTASDAVPSFVSSAAAPPTATALPAYKGTEAVPSFISSASLSPASTPMAVPAYTATEAVPSFLSSAVASSASPAPPPPAHTPTEAIPSFLSPSSSPAPSTPASPPAPTNATPSFLLASASATRCACASTTTITLTRPGPPPTGTSTPSSTDAPVLVTLYTTVTTTVCPEELAAAMAAAACAATETAAAVRRHGAGGHRRRWA